MFDVSAFNKATLEKRKQPNNVSVINTVSLGGGRGDDQDSRLNPLNLVVMLKQALCCVGK